MPRLSDSGTAASGALTESMWSTLLMLVLPPLFWSGNFIVGRALRDLVPPMALSFDRWVIALLCLLPFTWHIVRRDARRYWQHRWLVLGVSLTGVAAFNVLVYWGLQSTSAANGMMLNSFIPLLIAGLGALFYRQRLSAVQWLGVLVSFTGVMVIVAHGSWTVLRALQFATGDAIVFVATICWAFFTLWLKQIPADIDRRGLLLVQIVITLVVLAPLVAWEHVAGHVTHWNADSLMGVLFVGIFPSVLAFALYSAGVVRVGAARAGLFIHLLPVFGALLSVLVLHEALHLYQGVGMVVIFLGVALANRQRA